MEQFLPTQTGGSHPNPQSQTFCPKLFSHQGEEEIALLQDHYKGKDILFIIVTRLREHYCAFHKHANSEVQKPTDDCVFRCRQSP